MRAIVRRLSSERTAPNGLRWTSDDAGRPPRKTSPVGSVTPLDAS
jgi:hypothetical protein